MNRKIRAVVASLIVTTIPAAGLADAPAPDRERASWTLGGGVVFGYLDYIPTSSYSGSLLRTSRVLAVPGASGSLERRISARSWLFLNLQGLVQRDRADVPPRSYGYARDDARQLAVALGLRSPVTRPGAPVEVSATLGVHGGIYDADQRLVEYSTERRLDEVTWFAGASVGLAVMRELADGLALRLSTPILRGTYSRSRVREPQQPTRSARGVSAGLALAPQLELVLFF